MASRRSRFNSFADISGFFTMEKSMVSSAKNLILDFVLLSKSCLEAHLIQYLNNRNRSHLSPPVVFYHLNNFEGVLVGYQKYHFVPV